MTNETTLRKKSSKNNISELNKKQKDKEPFFLEIFNSILRENEKDNFVTFDDDGNIWFKLSKVLKFLNLSSKTKVNQKNIQELKKINKSSHLFPKFEKNAKFINEPGFYELVFISDIPLAKVFIKHSITQIIPSIIKKGKYYV